MPPSMSLHLGYACIWESERSRTWSGTPFHLLQALKEQVDTSVYDIDCTLSSHQSFFHKLRGLRYHHGTLISRYRFMPSYLKAVSRQCTRSLRAISSPQLNAIVQIGDIAALSDIPVYTYQDLSVHYILQYLQQRGKPLPMFTPYNERDLMIRWESQQRYYEHCAGIFTMSHWLRNYLIEHSIASAEKIHTVHAGTNVPITLVKNELSVQDIKSSSATKTILFVGREFERKGGDVVVEAFTKVLREYPGKVRLVIAGPKTWEACGTGKSIIPDGIEFLGDADYSTLRRYFAEADVFCMPSRFEAFGIVFAEALANGVPCIGRNAYAMPEIIRHGDNGYLLDEHAEGTEAIKTLAVFILKILEDENMQKKVRLQSKETVAYFSWNRVSSQMVNTLRREV